MPPVALLVRAPARVDVSLVCCARFALGRGLLALSMALCLSAWFSAPALARPPHYIPTDTLIRPFVIEPAPRATAAQAPSLPPSLRAALKRMGGSRALRVAQGLPAGKYVALRPMFWLTRDHSGAMFALGGLF